MTILLHDRKIIVFKTYKTGSTTLDDTLYYYTKETGEAYEELFVDGSNHTPWYKVKENFKDYDSYRKIATIRNPWDIVVSLFHYNNPVNNNYGTVPFDKLGSFEEWMKSLVWTSFTLSAMIFNKGSCVCDEVIRCENIIEDIKSIFDINPRKYNTQHQNKSKNRKKIYQEVHTNYTKSLINYYCDDEIREFGYEY